MHWDSEPQGARRLVRHKIGLPHTVPMRWRRERSRPPLADLQREYQAACDADEFDRQTEVLVSITTSYPDVSWGWYDLGLRMKWSRDWPASRAANSRALALLTSTAGAPEAWNLGIAATALGDWATARKAWTAFGVTLPGGPANQPIAGNFGVTPVRLNPDPRFAEPEFQINGQRFLTEVVWARRLCPTRARIENVPLPESGHRRGDVVLHDGDPVGHRRLGDSERSVFNEIALLERGPHRTLTTVIDAVDRDQIRELEDLFSVRGFAVESWTDGVQMLCRACSEGTPGDAHNHPGGRTTPGQTLALGIAAPPNEAEILLDSWLVPRRLERGPIVPTV
jgi:hypothetical protein